MSPLFHRHRRRALVLLLVLAAAILPFGPVRAPAGAGVAAAAQDTTPAAGEDASPFPGYWLVGPDGGVFSFGGANFYGSTGNLRLNQPVVGLAPTRTGDGYWFVATDGGIFSFGNAPFYGSTGAMKLNRPIVGMATTPTGWGYWLVASDGGIFSFGDARFYGSTGAMKLNRPIVAMAATPTGKGYWLVASDGGIFSFGDARFFGSTGAIKLNQPITGMGTTPTGDGYWLVAADGGLFSYGDASFWGSAAGKAGANRIVGILPSQTGAGYWEVSNTGEIFGFGDVKDFGSAPQPNHGVVGGAGVPTGAGLPVLPPVGGGAAGSRDNGPTTATTAPVHLPAAPPPGSLPAGKAKPNILFILLDDARSEGVMDQPGVLPKTKKWLAAGGVTFDEGFSTTSLCCPERATIWSGRLPHNHQVVDNYSGDNLDHDWISPRYLQDAGYRTALVGKFITDWTFRYEPPHFDQYAAFQGGYVNTPFWVKDPGDAAHKWVTAPYSTDFIADKAVQYVDGFKASGNQPWFMQVSPHAPHNNMEATKTACDINVLYNWPARDDNVATPQWQPSPAVTVEGDSNIAAKADKVPYVRNNTFPSSCGKVTYDGQMKTLLSVDDMVDRLMTTLQNDGQLANTMVILTSDNGFAHGDRGLTSKGLPYNEHVNVPFMVRWDGVFAPGTVDHRPVGGEDFLPTYLDAAQYTPPELRYALDGKSFLPGRPGKDVKYLEFGPVGRPTPTGYKGHRGIPTWASLRTTDGHYIEYYDADNVTVSFREYYDLRADPWELNNLLADNDPSNDPDVAAISARLHKLWTCVGTSGPNPCP